MTDSPRQGADTLGLGACTRRSLLKGSGAVAAASALQSQIAAQEKNVAVVSAAGAVPLKLNVNGMERTVQVETRTTLLDVLRNKLDHTAAKRVCDRGTCGACTVILNNKAVYACTVLAIDA